MTPGVIGDSTQGDFHLGKMALLLLLLFSFWNCDAPAAFVFSSLYSGQRSGSAALSIAFKSSICSYQSTLLISFLQDTLQIDGWVDLAHPSWLL